MPELPEVETIVRALSPRLRGQRMLRSSFLAPRVMRGAPEPRLDGMRIVSVERYGKHILVKLDGGVLAIHLGMTGKLLLNGAETAYTRARFELEKDILLFDDIRQFGRMEWNPERLERLGPEPLALSGEEFAARLKSHRTRIKALLLNQSFVRGMGNIYADEALFRARIHPLAIAARLGPRRSARLHQAIVEVLSHAIEKKGSSVSDYVDAQGQQGSFQFFHQVYRKQGRPCPACGSPLRRSVIAQRGTHYCPKCQQR